MKMPYTTNEIYFLKRIKKEIRNWKRRTVGLRKKVFKESDRFGVG